MERAKGIKNWSIADARELYGVDYWGKGIFTISEKGELQIKLSNGENENCISLFEIAEGIRERGMSFPVLLRFSDLLKWRIEYINKAFQQKISEYKYGGGFRGVYPIKVNQQEQVIEEITHFGRPFHHGLEAGSKAELMIALAYIKDPKAMIICNGYKDSEFIDLALYGLKMGLNIFLVVERPGELAMILKRSRLLKVEPQIGLRVKLSATVGGKWAESAGDHSVFGLNASQIVAIIDQLKQEEMLHILKLLHYHLGSQIPDIKDIRNAVGEASHYYIELVKEGAAMGYLDIGGGLAVDYDGSKTNFVSSRNYSVDEYCADIIEVIMETLDEKEIPHPTIVAEAGRAIVAYYSVLLFNVLDVNRLTQVEKKQDLQNSSFEMCRNLIEVYNSVSVKKLQENYHDAIHYRDEVRSLFLIGEVGIRERSEADQLFWKIIEKIYKLSKSLKYVPEEIQDLNRIMTDIYYGNFSLFQSMPDSWAIDQLFPIMPIHRLHERPLNPAIVADTTCDCDGKIDKFIDLYDIKRFLLLHKLKTDQDYIIGVFLVGAYQETLGDLHNLFGDTHAVNISLDENGEVEYKKELLGDSVSDVLSYVEYTPKLILEKIKETAERAVKHKRITPLERKTIMDAYEEGLQGYTYFES
jgi:arginine decarboxylase